MTRKGNFKYRILDLLGLLSCNVVAQQTMTPVPPLIRPHFSSCSWLSLRGLMSKVVGPPGCGPISVHNPWKQLP